MRCHHARKMSGTTSTSNNHTDATRTCTSGIFTHAFGCAVSTDNRELKWNVKVFESLGSIHHDGQVTVRAHDNTDESFWMRKVLRRFGRTRRRYSRASLCRFSIPWLGLMRSDLSTLKFVKQLRHAMTNVGIAGSHNVDMPHLASRTTSTLAV